MSSVLEEILASLDEEDKTPAPATARRTRVAAPATPPAAHAAPAKAARPATRKKSSASAIKDALSAIEPGTVGIEDIEVPDLPTPAAPVAAEPVERPGGRLYYPRMLAGRPDVEALRSLRKKGIQVLFYGYPGCGKTSLVEAAFADEGGPITFAGHGEAEIGDLVGTHIQNPDGTFSWNDGPLVRAMKEGKVLFVDDATLTPSGVLARLYPVMDGRGVITLTEHEGETITAKEGFYVVGAHNPGVPGAVLSEALSSRFSIHLNVPTDLTLAKELGVESAVISIAQKMQKKREEGEVMWAPEMRELLAYSEIKSELGREAALENLVSICPEGDREVFKPLLSKALATVRPLSLASTTGR